MNVCVRECLSFLCSKKIYTVILFDRILVALLGFRDDNNRLVSFVAMIDRHFHNSGQPQFRLWSEMMNRSDILEQTDYWVSTQCFYVCSVSITAILISP